jgi:hypothetical protein
MRLLKLACLTAFLVLPVVACMPMNGTFADYATPSYRQQPAPAAHGDGAVYVNNIRLNDAQRAILADILQEPFIPAGRWYITNEGVMGREGEAPVGNIVPYVRAYEQRLARRGGRGGGGRDEVINTRGGTYASNGRCAVASIPGMSITSGDC